MLGSELGNMSIIGDTLLEEGSEKKEEGIYSCSS